MRDPIPADAGPVLGVADFDLDGDADLLTHGTGIYLNDGNGMFAPHPVLSPIHAEPWLGAVTLSAAYARRVFAIGDLNGDGSSDVLALGGYPNVVMFRWMNQGNGVLVATSLGTAFATGGPPMNATIRAIALGDIDADGDLDVAVSRTTTSWFAGGAPQFSTLLLYLNNGAGVFTLAPGLPTVPMSPHQMELADFDGDGDVDLLASTGLMFPAGPYALFLNNGGTFAATGIALPVSSGFDIFVTADVDSDGLLDVVFDTAPIFPASNSCPASAPVPVLLLNSGNGAFWQTYSAITGPVVPSIPQLVDLDADTQKDLLRITPFGAEVYPVNPSAVLGLTFVAPIFSSQDSLDNTAGISVSTAVGDVDGDGDRDIVVRTAQGNQVLFNDSAATPVAVNDTLAAQRRTYLRMGMASGDFDEDGDEDLTLGFFDCGAGTTRLSVATNEGPGTLRESVDYPCPACPRALELGPPVLVDADGDGDLDACVARVVVGATPVLLVLTNSNGVLVVAQTFLVAGEHTNEIRTGDIDGDGDPDIVVGFSGGFRVLLNSVGSYQLSPSAGPGSWDFELADLDGDGDLDFVRSKATPGMPFVFLNDGSGVFVAAGNQPAATSSYTVEAGDIDGDGDCDLLMGNVIWVNSGAGVFSAGGSVPFVNWAPNATNGGNVGLDFRLLDIDGDGDLDVADSRGRIHRNTGSVWSTENLARPLPVPIVVADFDGDGDADLVSRDPGILSNATRQISLRAPPRPGRPAVLEIYAAPNTPWSLFASAGTGSLLLPAIGVVRLDLSSVQALGSGVVSQSGVSVVTALLPATPALVGFTAYLQAVTFEAGGPKLTGLEVARVIAY